MIHDLKCWPKFYDAILNGTKTFELRADDRSPPFEVGDELVLREYEPPAYTGRAARAVVTYVLRGFPGLASGFCILGIGPHRPSSDGGEMVTKKSGSEIGIACPHCGKQIELEIRKTNDGAVVLQEWKHIVSDSFIPGRGRVLVLNTEEMRIRLNIGDRIALVHGGNGAVEYLRVTGIEMGSSSGVIGVLVKEE